MKVIVDEQVIYIVKQEFVNKISEFSIYKWLKCSQAVVKFCRHNKKYIMSGLCFKTSFFYTLVFSAGSVKSSVKIRFWGDFIISQAGEHFVRSIS